MDILWLVAALVLWPFNYILDNLQSTLTGLAVGIVILIVYAVIARDSADKQQRDKKLHNKIDDLESKMEKEMGDLRRQLDSIKDGLQETKSTFRQ